MEHRRSLLLGLAAAAGVALVGIYLLTERAESGTGVPAATDVAPQVAPRVAAPPAPAAVLESAASPQSPVAQIIADTASPDAAKRAAAITALAEAPRAEALPVLGKLLTDGEPQIDRSLALRSLRELALNQGDDDGAIRDAVRHAIYHGDDFTKVDEVQETLDVIEESQKR